MTKEEVDQKYKNWCYIIGGLDANREPSKDDFVYAVEKIRDDMNDYRNNHILEIKEKLLRVILSTKKITTGNLAHEMVHVVSELTSILNNELFKYN